MGDKTNIEWTDATWNPIRGCSRISEGCRNCYAEGVANRFKGEGLPYEGLIASSGAWNGNIKLIHSILDKPVRWRKPRKIFVNSMSDLFHENLSDGDIDKVFSIMLACELFDRKHTFQVLTKRAERMHKYFTQRSPEELVMAWADAGLRLVVIDAGNTTFAEYVANQTCHDWNEYGPKYGSEYKPFGHLKNVFPLPNVWLGVSVEDQKTAYERIPFLLETPAATRWISAEPLIGPIDFSGMWADPVVHINMLEKLDWVVVGGESGKNARPIQPTWVRTIRDQCLAVEVPFFFKQWGEFAPNWFNDDSGNKIDGSEWIDRQGKKIAGRTLDGKLWNQFPEAI